MLKRVVRFTSESSFLQRRAVMCSAQRGRMKAKSDIPLFCGPEELVYWQKLGAILVVTLTRRMHTQGFSFCYRAKLYDRQSFLNSSKLRKAITMFDYKIAFNENDPYNLGWHDCELYEVPINEHASF